MKTILLLLGFILIISLYSCNKPENDEPKEISDKDTLEKVDTNSFFKAIINDSLWIAKDIVQTIYFQNDLYLWVEDENYRFIITIDNLKIGEQTAIIFFYVLNQKVHENFWDTKFNITEIDLNGKTISAEFEFAFDVNSSYANYYKQFVVKEGKINKLKFDTLYCEIQYELQSGNFEKFGKWKLAEIIDYNLDTIYFPPCGSNLTLELKDTLEEFYYDNSYDYSLIALGVCNEFNSTYSILNDSIIITSYGLQTLVGCSYYWRFYEDLYFSTISFDTFNINWNNNLMQLKSRDGMILKFYK